jgi:Ribbon-helix-helix protein, copG family
MRRTNIYLAEDQIRALQALSDRRGAPMAELVREAIDEWLKSQGVQVLDEDEWAKRFETLLARRRAVGKRRSPSPTELDRDVAEAIREVRRTRAAGRR